MKRDFFWLHMKKDFKDERNDNREIFVVYFICESILNKFSCL